MAGTEGAKLFATLNRGELMPGSLRIWWQGQLSYGLRGAAGTILVDPFLIPMTRRLVPPPFGLDDVDRLDAILVTHEHSDHFDIDFLVAALDRFPALRVLLPVPLVEILRARTPHGTRILGTQPGEVTDLGGVRVRTLPARHGISMTDAYSEGREFSGGLARYVGYAVDLGGVTVLHPGDTLVTEELLQAIAGLPDPIDVALLPINGRDYFREKINMVGNMDYREAAELAGIIGADLVIPGHYDMFKDNRGFPAHFVDVADRFHPELHVAVLSRSRIFNYLAPARPEEGP